MRSLLFVVTVMLCSCAGTAGNQTTADLPARLAMLISQANVPPTSEVTDAQRTMALRRALMKLAPELESSKWRSAADTHPDVLLQAFDAVSNVLFYTNAQPEFDLLQTLYAELDRRKALTRKSRRAYFAALVGMRDFDKAKSLNVEVEDLVAKLPITEVARDWKSQLPSVWVIDLAGQKMTKTNVDLSVPYQVVVVSSPFCGFSRAASEQITATSDLVARLKGVSVWVSPQDQNLAVSELADWNRSQPYFKIIVVDQAWQWPLPTMSSTPVFYLLKNGKVVDTLSGWPRDGANLVALNAKLDSNGFP